MTLVFFISPRSFLVGCCLALDPFGTGALFLMLQVPKGVAILLPCQLGNMRSDGPLLMSAEYCSYGHGHEAYFISSQFSPFPFFFFFCTCINQLSVQILLVKQTLGTIALGWIYKAIFLIILTCNPFSRLVVGYCKDQSLPSLFRLTIPHPLLPSNTPIESQNSPTPLPTRLRQTLSAKRHNNDTLCPPTY